MKKSVKAGVILLAAGLLVSTVGDAQRRPVRRTNTGTGNTQQEQTQTQTEQQTQQQTNNNNAGNFDPYAGIPIRVDTSGKLSAAGAGPSLRNVNGYEKVSQGSLTPLAYEHLREDDALYAHTIWRELDLREKLNQVFRYEAQGEQGSQLFVDILMREVRDGNVMAFSDDMFKNPLSPEELATKTAGSVDTVDVTDVNDINRITERVVTVTDFDTRSVQKIALKEQWIFDREASRMFVRIIGIAPVLTHYFPGTTQERGTENMFWVYYPDLRETLANKKVYNSKNMGQGRMTWEELLESRMFSSYITKSELNNAQNRSLRATIKDPILRLLEGENIKEKIFNFEQDLWEY